nr:hypothetical protein CFP56_50478 [Quercus suber]
MTQDLFQSEPKCRWKLCCLAISCVSNNGIESANAIHLIQIQSMCYHHYTSCAGRRSLLSQHHTLCLPNLDGDCSRLIRHLKYGEATMESCVTRSDAALLNERVLRGLRKAFEADPEVDLTSRIPASYSKRLAERKAKCMQTTFGRSSFYV